MGDLGGGVNAPGSGDAGMAGQHKLVKLAKACFPPGREPNSRSGAVTTVTLAIQIAAQIGGSASVLSDRPVTQRNATQRLVPGRPAP